MILYRNMKYLKWVYAIILDKSWAAHNLPAVFNSHAWLQSEIKYEACELELSGPYVSKSLEITSIARSDDSLRSKHSL